MAVRTVTLYNNTTKTTEGTIYYNTSTKAWYAESSCQTQITTINKPTYTQYKFGGYYGSTSFSGVQWIDGDGNIKNYPTSTSTSGFTLYSKWTKLSTRFVLNAPSGTTLRTAEFYRSVAASTHFYFDDQLTDEIDKILVPYASGKKFYGLMYTNSTTEYFIYADGTINTSSNIATVSSPGDPWTFAADSQVRMWQCYYIAFNANGGSGGQSSNIWWDRVNGNWASDDTMLQPITKLSSLPTRSGYIFNGYWSASSGGSQVVSPDGTLGTYSAVTSANKTVYAQWVSPITITANHGSGSGSFTNLYYGGGKFYTSSALTTQVTKVTIPTLANNRFLGYYSASSGGTQYIDASGNILSAFAPITATTIYAQYERVCYTITVERNGGSGVSALYANPARTAVYDNSQCSGDPLESVTPLTRAGYKFLGIFQTNSATGTQLITNTGTFTDAFATFLSSVNDGSTIYAIWEQVFTISLDQMEGGGAPGEIYYDSAYGKFYDSSLMATPVTAIVTPTRECYTFAGFYDSESGGVQRIGSDGTISATWQPTESTTMYARWTWKSWKYAFDADGGTTAQGAIYNDGSTGTFYADDQLTETATSVAKPTKPGYDFGGYYDGTTCVVAADGTVAVSSAMSADATATAKWTAKTYTLTFDFNGGSGEPETMSVTFGEAIGNLPVPSRARAYFNGWNLDGITLTAATAWTWPNDATAQAWWDLQFAGVVDYFNLASNILVPISSDSGDNKQRICVAHAGKYASGVNETSGVWRNPRVTYAVKKSGTLNFTLGKAWAATKSGTTMTVSGYMITTVTVQTAVGQFPTVTVEAVANEGADAINTWKVAVPVVARSKAQNLLYGVTGGGYLNACTLVATCDPVVVAENNMPCASDVVNGRLELSATTINTERQGEPTASGGFTAVGTPKAGTESYYTTYQMNAQKEL